MCGKKGYYYEERLFIFSIFKLYRGECLKIDNTRITWGHNTFLSIGMYIYIFNNSYYTTDVLCYGCILYIHLQPYYTRRYTLTWSDTYYIRRKRPVVFAFIAYSDHQKSCVFGRDIIDLLGFLKLRHINRHSSRAVFMKKNLRCFRFMLSDNAQRWPLINIYLL